MTSAASSRPRHRSDTGLAASLDAAIVDTGFSGAVRVARRGETIYEGAAGWADRAHEIANTPTTRFGIASGVKGFTALAVMALVGEGSLTLDTTVRSVLGDELELIDPAVTVRHLLTHTSGIGDYVDESENDVDDYVLGVPVHQLATTHDYLAVLRGHPMVDAVGERFRYCNGGFVILALVVEAVTGRLYPDVVAERVWVPAGMTDTAFVRTDQLPGDVAIGYVDGADGWRTNQLHLPVSGSGDGGASSTLVDFGRFWAALFDGAIVPDEVVAEMVRPHQDAPEQAMRYGLGFWLRADGDTVMLEGCDAGVSFRSADSPGSGRGYTVMSNTTDGAWPLVRLLDAWISGGDHAGVSRVARCASSRARLVLAPASVGAWSGRSGSSPGVTGSSATTWARSASSSSWRGRPLRPTRLTTTPRLSWCCSTSSRMTAFLMELRCDEQTTSRWSAIRLSPERSAMEAGASMTTTSNGGWASLSWSKSRSTSTGAKGSSGRAGMTRRMPVSGSVAVPGAETGRASSRDRSPNAGSPSTRPTDWPWAARAAARLAATVVAPSPPLAEVTTMSWVSARVRNTVPSGS